MLDWQLTPDGMRAKGRKTYHIITTRFGVYLRTDKGKGHYDSIGTFGGVDAVKQAMKAGDTVKRSTIRLVMAAINNAEIARQAALEDGDILGIIAKGQNVAFLVGLAFAIAASANLPALVSVLFWKGTTARGVELGIWTGLASSIGLIVIGPTIMGAAAIFPLANPGIVSIPLSFIVTFGVSMAQKK